MKNYKWILIVVNLLLLIAYINYAIWSKEKTIQDGQLILLELAPVDPRSLMQGDYMELNYAITSNDNWTEIDKRGYIVVKVNQQLIAEKVRMQKDKQPLYQGEYLINYTAPTTWRLQIGAPSYFFQEGTASKFEIAKYGGLKIDNEGNSVLIGLYDANRNLIQ